MAYLIDGNNLIGHLSPHELKDPASKHDLISKLLAFQHIKNTKIYLVFDGSPDPDIEEKFFFKDSFSIHFPQIGQNADSVIQDIISKQTDLRQFFVVSSDREIQHFARSARAKSINCRQFNKELRSALKEFKKKQELRKDMPFPSSLEVHHWMDIFKKNK